MELLLAGNPAAAREIPLDPRLAEDDPGGPVDLACGRVAAGIGDVGHRQVSLQERVHAEHAAAPAGPVEAEQVAGRQRRSGEFDEVEGPPVVPLLDPPGDLFEVGGGMIEFARDLDPQLRVAVDGVVVDGDAAVCGD